MNIRPILCHIMIKSPRKSLSASLAFAVLSILVLSAPVVGQGPSKAGPVFRNGEAQVVPEFQNPELWIRQTLWVETEFDSDGDGKPDRVHVAVTRPRQTETEGLKVAVIYESSPYYAGLAASKEYFWNVKHELGEDPPARAPAPRIAFHATRNAISNEHIQQWVPRGFAVVHSEAPGTGLSQGCSPMGARHEALAPKAVIDWLNGRAKGFTTRDGDDTVTAYWATGNVGMTGTSYNGTLALAAATTGVDGLKAIIPIAPLTSYYHYYRSFGLVRHPGGYLGEDIDVLYDAVNSGDTAMRAHCNSIVRDGEIASGIDRVTGDYNDFWAKRDYRAGVERIKAAMLMAHAFNDWNVMPEHSIRIYEALKKRDVPTQVYFHQGGHGGPPPLSMMNRWFTRFLYDVENGVEKDPKSWIVREGQPAGQPTSYADYPHVDSKPVTLYLSKGGNGHGALSIKALKGQGSEKFTDDVSFTATELASAENSPNRLLYMTQSLKEPLHISGWPTVDIRLSSSKAAANLSIWLVALSPGEKPVIITRGWADPQNYKSLSKSEPLVPGRFYDMSFYLQPDDQVIPAGSKIALMIFSSDRSFTLWPKPGTELSVDIDKTTISIPVVGGAKSFRAATE